jgi:hypothetical protein
MMLTRQVFYRQAYFRQVLYMSALKLNPSEIAEALQINKRFGSFLCKERQEAKLSLDQVAQEFSLSLRDLYDWELGIASPPAKVFFAIVNYYGPGAYGRAAELDQKIQMEKYDLIVGAKNGSPSGHLFVA